MKTQNRSRFGGILFFYLSVEELMTPQQLGRYEITGTLGRGAMGVVYEAHDPLIERKVAIKTISYAGISQEEAEEFEKRFFLEAKSAGRLNHPNIVTIYDVGRGNEMAYIAMEFLSGQSLRSVLDSGVVLPPEHIVRIATQVADGLSFAHASGVVHRDIKPANIMVLENNIVKISDFGIALLPSGSLTMDGKAVGSPKYMSPEQVLGKKPDGRSDIFSLGAVLYEMLTGHPPFTGADLNAILYQVLNGAPALPSSLNPGLPPGFDRIVARALSKDPEKRYQNAADMAADLRNYRRTPGLLQSSDKGNRISATPGNAAGEASIERPETSPTKEQGHALRPSRFAIPALALLIGVGGYFGWQQYRPQAVVPSTPGLAESQQSAIQPATPSPASPDLARTQAMEHPQQASESARKVSTPANASRSDARASRRKAPETTQPQKAAPEKAGPQANEPPPALTKQEKQLPAADWKAELRAALTACQSEPVFSRVLCNEKARWKYCPGHWGNIDECPKSEPNKAN